ncbi:class III poly(R)-hydroxyalkanoic acid synthase subunit PhaC [Anabaena sp. UHCC 0204]|uniref:class III poly(R)-hydroxyalkanoic acid synthase subunit PhaC n=1 Tax=Anabaena sp. UHCC 0204 TaxID=2590009 RepID=UPI001448764E|nr:class III poly(R)-hydroxyalkanoic acid synthase subunit PhaC [Anabaena sp. UHCC 0204]MTJ09551.1 class III poly(R)-hydroxyalkanoic acid synthase subunit PhaC [Anabaena sp. UHCC 0204]
MSIQNYIHEYSKFISNLIQLYQASLNYQILLSDVYRKAFLELIHEFSSADNSSKILDKLPEIIQIFANKFDREFADKFRSPDAVIIQGKFLNIAIANWSYQQQLVKEFTPIMDFICQINPINIVNYFYEDKIQVGITPKVEIYKEDQIVLYHYSPDQNSGNIPILIVYALVNRPYIIDLQAGRSFVANLLKLGFDVYLIDWGYPQKNESWLTLDKYINGYINNCVDVICKIHHLPQLNLLGICQGGTFSLCYSSLHPEKVKNLITMITPVDFHINDGLLNIWSGSTLGNKALDVDLMVDTLGNIPGDFLNYVFLMLKPFQLGVKKYIDLLEIIKSEEKLLNFLRMEKWIFDSPDQAGETFRQVIKDLYQGNKLIKGEIEIGNQRVDLSKIQIPILNIYAEQDHLVPPTSSLALEKYISSDDYTVHSFPVGHIGIYVSSKVQKDLPLMIGNWLKIRI